MATIEDTVLTELHRASVLADRANIVVLSDDIARLNARTGSRSKTHDALNRLRNAARIRQVRRGVLVLPDSTGIYDVDLEELIAAVFAEPYLITGGAALQAHGLLDEHFFQVTVLATRPTEALRWQRQSTRLVITAPGRIWGGAPATPRGPHRARPLIAAPERAILDAVSNPRYGVSLTQAMAALRRALSRDADFALRLREATVRYRSDSTARRVGLLVEALSDAETAAPFHALIGTRQGAIPLRPSGGDGGPVDPRWRVRVNADLALLAASSRS